MTEPRQPFARQRGFTLLELMVVLLLASLVMAVVPIALEKPVASARFKAAIHELAATLKQAQTLALAGGEPRVVVIDLERREYQIEGTSAQHALPASATVKFVTAREEQLTGSQAGIRFYPDGGSTGGQVMLSNATSRYTVDIDWLTGQIRIYE